MKKLLIAAVIGLAAGIVDIVPMIIQGIDGYSTASAVVHWVLIGPLVAYLNLPLRSWLKGIVVSEALAIPIAILVMRSDMKSVVPILAMSIVLGAVVGAAVGRFCGDASTGKVS